MTVYDYDRVQIRIRGTINDVQTWSTGYTVYSPEGAPSGLDGLQAYVTSLHTPTATWWNASNGPKVIANSDTKIVSLEGLWIEAGNTMASAVAVEAMGSSECIGTGSSATQTQAALVLSLRTPNTTARGRGRMYLPATGYGALIGSAHYLNTTSVDGIANATKTYFDDVNALTIEGDTAVIVVGSQLATPPTVTSVRVDNELDVQRRRANKIKASYIKSVTLD